MKAAKNSWIWAAMDFADGEKAKLEKFTVSFRTEEQSKEFRKVFEGAQATAPKTSEKTTTTVSSQQPAGKHSFSNQFTSKSRTWFCNTCCVYITTDINNCVSCDTPKSGSETVPFSAFSGTPVKFGTPSATGPSQQPPVQQGFGNNQFVPRSWGEPFGLPATTTDLPYCFSP